MHNIQLQIIKKLVFSKESKFSKLKKELPDIDNNQFCFHLNALQKENLVKKENNIYTLTNEGLSLSEKLDTEKMEMKKQAKLTVYLGVVNDNNEVLIYTRKKSPFYDCQGFGGGRVEYGEDIVDAAKRELKEETGLDGDPELIKILHNKMYAKDTKELVVDKILFYFKISNPTGTLISTDEGFYEWVKIDDLSEYIVKPFDSKDEFLRQVEYLVNWDGKITLEEQSQEVESY